LSTESFLFFQLTETDQKACPAKDLCFLHALILFVNRNFDDFVLKKQPTKLYATIIKCKIR